MRGATTAGNCQILLDIFITTNWISTADMMKKIVKKNTCLYRSLSQLSELLH